MARRHEVVKWEIEMHENQSFIYEGDVDRHLAAQPEEIEMHENQSFARCIVTLAASLFQQLYNQTGGCSEKYAHPVDVGEGLL